MKVLIKDKYYLKLLLLGILLRFLIMPFFFHPDIKTYHFQSSFLKSGAVNIYKYLEENKKTLPLKEEFVYFPLSYLTLGGYQIFAGPFLGEGFSGWLYNAGQQSIDNIRIFRYLFILKLPYLIIDIAIAFLLTSFFNDEKRKKLIFFFWLFNPFTVILIYLYSNIDIIPVLMSVISLLMIKKNKGFWAGMALAIGAGFKGYPLLLLPSLLLTNESIKKKLTNIAFALLVIVFILIPFWSEPFINSAFSSGLTNRIFDFGINIGFPKKIPYYIIIYSIGFIYIYLKDRKLSWSFYLLVTLLLVAMVDYHIQWLLWCAPFVLVAAVKDTKNMLLAFVVMTLGITIPMLLNDRFMTSSLYSPVSYLFHQVSYPYIFIKQYVNPTIVQNVLHYIFIASAILLVWKSILYEKRRS